MIGYYAHHLGAGHLARAAVLAALVSEPAALLSSRRPRDESPFAEVVCLPDDVTDRPLDPTAGGSLHWAPLRHSGLADRMDQIAGWVRRRRPSAMVVDVSVEVATLVRLLGVPVVVLAMPGLRDDLAHQRGYDVATRIVAPWKRQAYDPPWLRRFGERVHYVGAFSRFHDRTPPPPKCPPARGLVLSGAGGSTLTASDIQALQGAHPQLRWQVAAPEISSWAGDVWAALCDADVVVTSAGQNAVAEVADAARPAVVVPGDRPHREQQETAHALQSNGIARSSSTWAGAASEVEPAWRQPVRWSDWSPSGAALAAAGVIDEVASM